MLQSMGSQRVGHDRATELNWEPLWNALHGLLSAQKKLHYPESATLRDCRRRWANDGPGRGHFLRRGGASGPTGGGRHLRATARSTPAVGKGKAILWLPPVPSSQMSRKVAWVPLRAFELAVSLPVIGHLAQSKERAAVG